MRTARGLGRASRHGALFLALWGLSACGGGGGSPVSVEDVRLLDFAEADVVFGQAGFRGQDGNRGGDKPSADALYGPGMAAPDPSGDGLLYLPDTGNHRILGFLTTPQFNNLAAQFVLGQPSFEFRQDSVGYLGLDTPTCAVASPDRLYVVDHGNNRVLLWEGLPLDTNVPFARVLGQGDELQRAAGAGAAGLRAPLGMCVSGQRILVADSGNHRILVWNTHPSSDGMPADLVLGQVDFDTVAANRGLLPHAGTLQDPSAVWTDGERLVVADRGNNRVLVWLTFPQENGAPADVVLGQSDFRFIAGGAGAGGMRLPSDIATDGGRLLVADAGNNRILSWHVFPSQTGAPADGVLGQSDFDHTAPNDDNQDGVPDLLPSGRVFSSSGGGLLSVCRAGNKIFVGDPGNHRLLIYHEQ